MIFGLGGHPGFHVPLKEDLWSEDYQLRFPASCRPTRVGFTPDCVVSGENAPYVCIEPWLSLPAYAGETTVLEDRPDHAHLGAGETYRNEWSISDK